MPELTANSYVFKLRYVSTDYTGSISLTIACSSGESEVPPFIVPAAIGNIMRNQNMHLIPTDIFWKELVRLLMPALGQLELDGLK